MEREHARDRREAWLVQHDQGKVLFHEWHSAVQRRLDSDKAYTHFEEVHRRYWDLFRHIGMPSTELSLTVQRHRDGKTVDSEPLIEALESQQHFRPQIAHLVKQLLREGQLSNNQKCRVRRVLLRRLAFDGWHRHFCHLARLARALDSPELRQQLQALPSTPQLACLLTHLEQEAKMASVSGKTAPLAHPWPRPVPP